MGAADAVAVVVEAVEVPVWAPWSLVEVTWGVVVVVPVWVAWPVVGLTEVVLGLVVAG